MKRLFLLLALLSAPLLAQNAGNAPVTKKTGTNLINEDLVFGSGRTLNVSAGTVVFANNQIPLVGVGGLGTGVATWLATPTSANLAAAVTNETGSGALVFATSPTLITPALGTPTALVLTNATGLPWSSLTGKPTTISGYGITDGVTTARTISTTAPLTGGGDLSANRTLAISTATTSAVGAVQLATSAQAITGTDITTATTPAAANAALHAYVDPLVAARSTAPGINLDGTNCATLSNSANTVFGTGNFTISFFGPGYAASLSGVISFGTDQGIFVSSTGISFRFSASETYTWATSQTALYTVTRSGSSLSLYQNGTLISSQTITGSVSLTALTYIGAYNATAPAVYLTGSLSQIKLLNRALSATEVATLFQTGQLSPADTRGGAYGVQVTSGFTIATGTTTVGSGPAVSNISSKLPGAGLQVRFRGTLSGGTLTLRQNDGVYALKQTITAGAFDFTVTATTSGGWYFDNASGSSATVSSLVIDSLGALLNPDSTPPGFGYLWCDDSGNTPAADIILPPSGVTWSQPATAGRNAVRGRLSWSGTHEGKSLLGQIALSPGSVIQDITIKASSSSSGSGITIGTTNSDTRYVTATTYTTAKKAFAGSSLANSIPAGSATGDLDLVVTPDTANYTGTIDVTVDYTLTTGTP